MTTVDEWIPTYLCYQGYKRMLSTVYQMTAEKRPVTAEEVAKDMDILKRSVSAGLTFLESISVVKGDGIEYRLTPAGIEYAHAIKRGRKESVRKSAYAVLESSHLARIVKYLETNKENLKVEDLYALVKKEAAIPDANGPFGIKSDHATGVDSLLHILQSAGIVPTDINLEAALQKELERFEKAQHLIKTHEA